MLCYFIIINPNTIFYLTVLLIIHLYKMLYFLQIINICLSQLTTRSPDPLFNLNFNYSAANFGNPALYQIYGKINIATHSDCQLNFIYPDDFVLIESNSYCSYEDLALSAQNQGAKLIMFTISSLYPIYPKNKKIASEVEIICIGVLEETFETLNKNSDLTIWATFMNEINIGSKVTIRLILSGNYTLDYNYLTPILNFNPMTDSENDYLSVELSYLSPYDELITDQDRDCYLSRFNDYLCMVSEGGVTGAQKYMNSRLICKFFNTPNLNMVSFLNSLQNLYKYCEFDYSRECFEIYISYKDGPESYYNTNSYNLAPYYKLNEAYFFWPSYFIKGALLSDDTSQSDEENCEWDCKNSQLSNQYCDLSCNTSSCGYDNLLCLYTENCLNFLIGDGNCDSSCISETDCNENSCSTGCYYSDMSSNLCPGECQGYCFDNCNQDLYCSAGCSFKTMDQGECSGDCSSDCYEEHCSKYLYCSPGCSYSDWRSGVLSEYCTSSCRNKYFNQCYSNCDYQYTCTDTCNSDCCENYDSSESNYSSSKKSSVNVIALIVSFIIIGML